jgi:hypothetical protein
MDWKYEDERIYSVDVSNNVIAETTYVFKTNGEVDINHTYVHPSLRGKGIAGSMMEIVAEYLREKGWKASATCSYANAWLRRHRSSYSDIVSEDIDGDAMACKIDGKH